MSSRAPRKYARSPRSRQDNRRIWVSAERPDEASSDTGAEEDARKRQAILDHVKQQLETGSWRDRSGCTGSPTGACSNPSATCRPPSSSRRTINDRIRQPPDTRVLTPRKCRAIQFTTGLQLRVRLGGESRNAIRKSTSRRSFPTHPIHRQSDTLATSFQCRP